MIEYLNLNYVPVLDDDFKLPQRPKDLLKLADGQAVFDPSRKREGLVAKSNVTGESFKIISNAWLESKDKE